MMKSSNVRIFLLGIMLGSCARDVFPQAWRAIEPLHTTRRQVEKRLGSPTIVGSVETYYFKHERVEVFYAEPCGGPYNPSKWNVPNGTVLTVEVIPKKKPFLRDLLLDLLKFRKEQGSFDNPDNAHLIDDEVGVTYSYSLGTDLVEWYSFGPKRSDKSKRCPGHTEADDSKDRNCISLTFNIDCSSEEIWYGNPVECRVHFPGTNPEFRPTIKWSVSGGASQVEEGDNSVKVSLQNKRKRRVTILAKLLSPNICADTASVNLRVGRRIQ